MRNVAGEVYCDCCGESIEVPFNLAVYGTWNSIPWELCTDCYQHGWRFIAEIRDGELVGFVMHPTELPDDLVRSVQSG